MGPSSSRVKNLWENSGTRKNFTSFSPAHVSLLPSRSTGTATLGAPHSWQLHPKNDTNQAGSIPGSQPIQFPPHPSPTPPPPHLLPGKRGAGPVAALGEQLENRGTGGSFVGLITQREPFWVCSAEPCPIFPLSKRECFILLHLGFFLVSGFLALLAGSLGSS